MAKAPKTIEATVDKSPEAIIEALAEPVGDVLIVPSEILEDPVPAPEQTVSAAERTVSAAERTVSAAERTVSAAEETAFVSATTMLEMQAGAAALARTREYLAKEDK
jgi:hypothetical protein